MKTTIVYAHPYKGSFNHAVLEEVCADVGDYHLIDLYADGFDPALSEADLAVYSKGGSTDPLVARYNEYLDDTDRIVFIFPIWWYDMPAIMRGFLDKVLLSGSAYVAGNSGLYPLRNIEKTYLFTTSTTPTGKLITDFGDPMHNANIASTLEICGFHNMRWQNLGAVESAGEFTKMDHLTKIRELLSE